MNKTKVVHCKREPYDVYIGRGSDFGNPFIMNHESKRSDVIEQYEAYAREKFTREQLKFLVGKRLGCWCAPKACHGDVLIKLIQEYGLE